MKREPKDLFQYHFNLMEAFYKFLKDENEENLMNVLYSTQSHMKTWIGGKDKDLWLRFFHGATEATTIQNIYIDLHDSNRKYLLENMQICCDTAEIEVYFS